MPKAMIETYNDYPSVLVRNNDVERALLELRNKIENISMFKITRRRHKSFTIQQRLRKKRRLAIEYRKKEYRDR
ncbi:MAG: hypothetical protein ABII68_04840 [Pseudomonadota bacterium]